MKKNIWLWSFVFIILGIVFSSIYACKCVLPQDPTYLEILKFQYSSTGLRFSWPFYILSVSTGIYGLIKWKDQAKISKVMIIIILIGAISELL